MNKKMNIVVGHYGSGKTEFSVNLAIQLKKTYNKVYIVDLDIVNPYFRTNDVKEMLTQNGVEVVASPYASTNVDVPSLPSDIFKVFCDKDSACVFDVGGDDDGSVALGRFKQYFDKIDYNMYFIVNTFRPLSRTSEDIIALLRDIEKSSRLNVTALVNNANIAHLTTCDDVLSGETVCKKVSEITGIPVEYTSGMEDVLSDIPPEKINKPFYIKRYLMLDF